MKKIAILGSTGSIGTQTLEVIRENKDIEVTGLAAGTNVDLLEKQIREFQPKLVAMWTEEKAKELKSRIRDLDVKVVSGMDGLLEIATMEESEILVTAIVGMIGIRPTIAAIKAGKDIALANKETLVTAGHIIMPLAKECGVKILPVDSEHSAIFQSLQGSHGKNELKKILLTASGGPFRGKKQEDLLNIRVEDALKHPNWAMGRKITIDSSTMVNKGLEVMEARWLFNVDIDDVQVVVQPQSVIHSMVEYVDGAVIAQLGTPDMKLPIQYALYYPERRFLPGERVDFWSIGHLDFEKPDMDTFYGLALAYEAGRCGGTLPTVFNAANELAVSQFLNREIKYLEITEIIEDCMKAHKTIANPTVEQILDTEQETYDRIRSRRQQMGIVLAILLFGFIVFFHELGHFLLARINGINVYEFWIGMGPTLAHKKIGNTDYCLKILPIGGACVMGEDEKEDLSEGSFNSKSPWRRISVIAAGPVFNFILAFIGAFIIICFVGVDKPVIGTVNAGTPAAEAGLQAGDEIVKINDKSIHIFKDISTYNQFHQGQTMKIVYKRNGEKNTVSVTPEKNDSGYYLIGITSSNYVKTNVFETAAYSAYNVKYWINLTIDSLKQLVTGRIGVDQLSGPVGAVDTTYKESKSGGALLIFLNLLQMTILLSANLGVMNLLPLPALDGGRLVFLIVEVIRGKRVPPEKEGYVHLAGMALFLCLMVFVMYNDIRRIFF